MSATLASLTSLPNLHPALVHFPIALAIAALVFGLASFAVRRQVWIEHAAAALALLSAVGAGAAYLAGRSAADSVGILTPSAEAALASHADIAQWTLAVLTVAGLLLASASARDRRSAVARLGLVRLSGFAALVAGVALVAVTADRGGALVFRHAVAVTPPAVGTTHKTTEPAASPASAPQSASDRLRQLDNGVLEWRPLPTDADAIGSIMDPQDRASAAAVTAVAEASGAGLRVDVSGPAVLLFPGALGDLVIEATIDVSDFRGSVGLAHHVSSDGRAAVFTASTQGAVSLTVLDGSEKVLDTASVRPLSETVTLETSVSGHHLKGSVDGRLLVHGHGEPGPGTRVALRLDGSGTVRLQRVFIQPAAGSH